MYLIKKCKHNFIDCGLFYKEYLSEYSNNFDYISVYKKLKCINCGKVENKLVSREQFLPELYKGRDNRKDKYIKYLNENNIYTEIELELKLESKTILLENNINCND